MARFLLELRAVYLYERSPLGSFDTKFTFVEAILGNMGASLNPSWIISNEEDGDNGAPPQFSDLPLGVDLLRSHE